MVLFQLNAILSLGLLLSTNTKNAYVVSIARAKIDVVAYYVY